MSKKKQLLFTKFARATATMAGRPLTFIVAALVIVVWGVTGPLFGFSDTWQLVINTGTTIVTFLMVFLIQNTQNRDTLAVQLKLDELIYAITEANNDSLDLEDEPDEDLEGRRERMVKLANEAKRSNERGK